MVEAVIALGIIAGLEAMVIIVMGAILRHRKTRVCDLCEDVDDAFSFAAAEGVVDCGELTARDIAEMLLSPIED